MSFWHPPPLLDMRVLSILNEDPEDCKTREPFIRPFLKYRRAYLDCMPVSEGDTPIISNPLALAYLAELGAVTHIPGVGFLRSKLAGFDHKEAWFMRIDTRKIPRAKAEVDSFIETMFEAEDDARKVWLEISEIVYKHYGESGPLVLQHRLEGVDSISIRGGRS